MHTFWGVSVGSQIKYNFFSRFGIYLLFCLLCSVPVFMVHVAVIGGLLCGLSFLRLPPPDPVSLNLKIGLHFMSDFLNVCHVLWHGVLCFYKEIRTNKLNKKTTREWAFHLFVVRLMPSRSWGVIPGIWTVLQVGRVEEHWGWSPDDVQVSN